MLKAEQISKQYFRKAGEANFFLAVQPLSLELAAGEVTVLTGRSGSGKTTLLHMLSGLLRPSQGSVTLDGTDLYALEDQRLSALRNQRLAVIPQGRSGIETLSVLENILLPGLLFHREDRRTAAEGWMAKLGIANLRDARPAELSGGELRRMALARAFTQDTDVILADEPTGDLDDENTALVLESLKSLAHEEGKTVFLVTHEEAAFAYADRVLRMDGGKLLFSEQTL